MSDITNCWDPQADLPTADVRTAWLYRPEAEWTYSHHPSLTHFRGRYYAVWSNGRRDEDAPGQRVLVSTSEDFSDWSEPRPLIDTRQGEHCERVLTPAGFHQHGGGLVVYCGGYEYHPDALVDGQRKPDDMHHVDTRLEAIVSPDGEKWSEPTDLHLPMVPNHGPQATRSGRLIISGNVCFPHTDDPCGLSGWTMRGIYPPGMAGRFADDSEGFHVVAREAGWPVGLCEGAFYQTDDGVLHMLLRSGTPRLWVTESADDGESWSPPEPTDFSDNITKFHFGRLPDGRFYYVGCPDPPETGSRRRLVLSLSTDGVRFDDHRVLADEPYERKVDGMHKGGDYGYPHTILHDGSLCVIVSRKKEAVMVLRTPIAGL